MYALRNNSDSFARVWHATFKNGNSDARVFYTEDSPPQSLSHAQTHEVLVSLRLGLPADTATRLGGGWRLSTESPYILG